MPPLNFSPDQETGGRGLDDDGHHHQGPGGQRKNRFPVSVRFQLSNSPHTTQTEHTHTGTVESRRCRIGIRIDHCFSKLPAFHLGQMRQARWIARFA